MKEKIRRGIREIMIWINRIAAVSVAVCMVFICATSVIHLDTGKMEWAYVQTPVERERVRFEDSQIYKDVLQNQIIDITRMCVIRNQMETNGVYNGKKIIDISEFANRDELIEQDMVTAQYYLDDLIKWGNYGFDYETITTSSGNKSILFQRYKTVEGKELSEYAETDEEYKVLVSNLQIAASELFLNYTEYTKSIKEYDSKQSNIIYCYGFMNNGKMSYYSNTGQNLSAKTPDEISSMFSKYNQFISYNPDKMQLSTNTSLNAQDMRSILMNYAYSFQDNSRVWIGVTDTYEKADLLGEAYRLYSHEVPYFVLWIIIAVASLVVFLLTFIYITKLECAVAFTGKKLKRIERSKKIPLEIYLLLWVVSGITLLLFAKEVYHVFYDYTLIYMAATVGAIILIYHIIFMTLYLCGVRKIKSKCILRESIIFVLFKKIKQGALETYDNGHLVSRTWLPYLLFLTVNLVLVLIGVRGIAIAFIIDMIVGAWIYVSNKERQHIIEGIDKIKNGDFTYKVSTEHVHGDNLMLAKSVNSIGSAIHSAVETSMKDEKMKADLITNVSHDIKTPLTSIINYVDLIKREQIDNERIRGYIEVLDAKSQRLKQLTDDLVEASKISSGNITVQFSRIDIVEFTHQMLGEFYEKFDEKQLNIMTALPENSIFIKADSRHLFRVIENIYNNVYKYALQGTRVYLGIRTVKVDNKERVVFDIKNISAQPLNVSAEELMERFVQGDESRMTEGSGLGLSIAKNLMQSLEGDFDIQLDGDLFKVILTFDTIE